MVWRCGYCPAMGDNPYCLFNSNQHCYSFFLEKLSHDEYEQFCKTQETQGLTTIKDPEVAQWVRDGTPGAFGWIGLKCTGNTVDSCTWNDGTSDHPDASIGPCVAFNFLGYWVSVPCDKIIFGICECTNGQAN